ncbi:MAG: family 2 glycosyl transferase [uncultured bacterium]|nr:MAG: family 2 glycosyl transferase [uncultured bacterium]
MFSEKRPLISIGFPVFNGELTLQPALESILKQTFRDFEVIISDNCSTDRTPEICQSFASDARIVYYRQTKPVKAIENFKFVLEKAQAPYFMFAAHDDLRSHNFLERLFEVLEGNPDAALAFSDLEVTSSPGHKGVATSHCFETIRQPLALLRMLTHTFIRFYHIYGLWRTSFLRAIPFTYTSYSPDRPIMMAAAAKGRFIYTPHALFVYLSRPKTDRENIAYLDLGDTGKSLIYRQLHCIMTTFKTVASVSSFFNAFLAALFVSIKFSIRFLISCCPSGLEKSIKKLHHRIFGG